MEANSSAAPSSEDLLEQLRTPHHNRKGQLLRDKGQKTRTSIIVEALNMLAEGPLSEVNAANITKRLGLNPAAFYRYFADMGEVLVAAYECVLEDAEKILPLLDGAWADGETAQGIEFLDAFHTLWTRFAPLIRARNSLADAGDSRFILCCRQLLEPFAEALAKQLPPRLGAEGEASSLAVAGVLLMAMERTVTVATYNGFSPGYPWPGLRRALSECFAAVVAGRQAPIPG